jgi:trehalose 6-phosphate phosphatase
MPDVAQIEGQGNASLFVRSCSVNVESEMQRRVAIPLPPFDLLAGASLFLDFDGTLVELEARPDSVQVSARLKELVARLQRRLDGRIAIISGRAATQVLHLFGKPRFTVAGSHGLEFHFADGRTVLASRPPDLAPIVSAMRALARTWHDLLVEEKPLGAALHFRQNVAAESACIALAEGLAVEHGLTLQTGKMMIEVRAKGGDKGSALRALMTDQPFADTRPVFIGDDDTDEAGFSAAASLGGAGILVGSRRPTAARYRLPDVSAVLRWLDKVSKA